MEEEVADPCSWTILDDKEPALSREVYSFRIRFPKRWDGEPDLPGICTYPRPFRNSGMWCFDVVLEEELTMARLGRGATQTDPFATGAHLSRLRDACGFQHDAYHPGWQ